MPSEIVKDPQAVLPYKWDWAPLTNGTGASDWLASGETITVATVTSSVPLTLIVDSSSITDASTTVTAWLSGGTDEVDYDVVCHITTSGAKQDDRTMKILARSR